MKFIFSILYFVIPLFRYTDIPRIPLFRTDVETLFHVGNVVPDWCSLRKQTRQHALRFFGVLLDGQSQIFHKLIAAPQIIAA